MTSPPGATPAAPSPEGPTAPMAAEPTARTMPAHTSVQSQPMGQPMLELAGVRAAYGRIEVLHGVDLSVPAGVGVRAPGPERCRKVDDPEGRRRAGCATPPGACRSRAYRWRSPAADVLARNGVCSVPEGRAYFPNLTVRENLLMWTYRGGVKPVEAESRAFERFPKLADRRKQLAGTLSGGEQQMLAVARALVRKPKLLLLDEISMGLAPLIVGELFSVVRQLADEGITIVLAEQFVHTALELGDPGSDRRPRPCRARGCPVGAAACCCRGVPVGGPLLARREIAGLREPVWIQRGTSGSSPTPGRAPRGQSTHLQWSPTRWTLPAFRDRGRRLSIQ